jgi:hypothetical protein
MRYVEIPVISTICTSTITKPLPGILSLTQLRPLMLDSGIAIVFVCAGLHTRWIILYVGSMNVASLVTYMCCVTAFLLEVEDWVNGDSTSNAVSRALEISRGTRSDAGSLIDLETAAVLDAMKEVPDLDSCLMLLHAS